MVTKLMDLSIGEVSGVDEPANLLRGFMVSKAAGKTPLLGPDQPWDVAAAETRIRAATKATERPTADYASCFLWKSADGVPESFGDYKFLVCDEVDGVIKVMPQALRAVAVSAPTSSIPEDEKQALGKVISELEKRAGIAHAKDGTAEEAMSIVGKIKNLVFPAGTEQQEVDMTKEELTAELDARFAAQSDSLVKTLTEAVTAAPAGTDGAASTEIVNEPAASEPETALTVADITKGVDEAIQPVLEIIEKVLERVERLEGAQAISTRKSIEGQEGQPEGEVAPPETPTVADAIAKVLRNPALPVARERS